MTKSLMAQAAEATEATYQALFEQGKVEARRLGKVNSALEALEETLLDPKRIAELDGEFTDKIELMNALRSSSFMGTRTLMDLSKLVLQARLVDGVLKGYKRDTQNEISVIEGSTE